MIAAVLFAPRPAVAHPVPFSYLDLRIGDDAIDGSLVVHMTDVAHELSIEPAERLIDPDFAAGHQAALDEPAGRAAHGERGRPRAGAAVVRR